jgi:hypothetical protein
MNSTDWLAGYLNDHVGGANLALDLAAESRRQNPGGPLGRYLGTLSDEIVEDRDTLLAVMEHLGIPPSGLKRASGRLAERATRWKFQAPVGVQPLANRLLELEALLMGIRGKQAMWETLGSLASSEPRLASFDFVGLTARAAEELRSLSAHRLQMLEEERARG